MLVCAVKRAELLLPLRVLCRGRIRFCRCLGSRACRFIPAGADRRLPDVSRATTSSRRLQPARLPVTGSKIKTRLGEHELQAAETTERSFYCERAASHCRRPLRAALERTVQKHLDQWRGTQRRPDGNSSFGKVFAGCLLLVCSTFAQKVHTDCRSVLEKLGGG